MKEKYIKPDSELELFETVDVITTSSDVQGDDNDVPFGS